MINTADFTIETVVFDNNTTDVPPKYSGDMLIYNDAPARVLINGFPVDPGATLSIGANEGERNVSKIKINWLSGASGKVYIMFKQFPADKRK